MKKVYKLLPWLTTSDATHFLSQLTDTLVTADQLALFCEADHCSAYVACDGVKGEQCETLLTVCAAGLQKLTRPEHMTREVVSWDGQRPEEVLFAHRPLVAGPGWLYSKDSSPPRRKENLEWQITNDSKRYQAIFKPADIQALADKMNGAPDSASTAAENTDLLRELAENTAEIATLRQKLALAQPEKLLHSRESKSVSQIIAVLAAMAELDISAPYAADETLRAAAATSGLELPNSPETVVKFLKAAGTRPDKN